MTKIEMNCCVVLTSTTDVYVNAKVIHIKLYILLLTF